MIRRTLTLGALVFGVLTIAQLFKGDGVTEALAFAGLWTVITMAVFTVVRVIQSRRNAQCAVCEGPAEKDDAVVHA